MKFGFTFEQDDFVLGKKLGEGAFGVVYRVSLAKKSSSNVSIALTGTPDIESLS